MDLSSVNIPAVIVAAILGVFGLGGLWYSPWLFGNLWNKEAKMDPKDKKNGHGAVVFGVSFVMGLISAWGFALYIGQADVRSAVTAGFFVGIFFVATSFAINYMFSGRSFKLLAIDGVYHILQFALYGLILGFWH